MPDLERKPSPKFSGSIDIQVEIEPFDSDGLAKLKERMTKLHISASALDRPNSLGPAF